MLTQASVICLHSSRQGATATRDELTMSAFLTVQLDRSLGGQAVQVGRLYLPNSILDLSSPLSNESSLPTVKGISKFLR